MICTPDVNPDDLRLRPESALLSILMSYPGGPDRADGTLVRVLAALSAVMFLALVVTGFVVIRAIEDRDFAEDAQRAAEQSAVEAGREPAPLPESAPASRILPQSPAVEAPTANVPE